MDSLVQNRLCQRHLAHFQTRFKDPNAPSSFVASQSVNFIGIKCASCTRRE